MNTDEVELNLMAPLSVVPEKKKPVKKKESKSPQNFVSRALYYSDFIVNNKMVPETD